MLEAIFDGLILLRLLHLKDCCNLDKLPANISSLSSLYELRLDGSSVEELPDSIKYLSELEIQSLDNCSKLRCLPELPSRIKEFQANNCTSLMTVSTLKSFSINMVGMQKYISFKNNIKMELDGPSLERITEDVILTMKSAAFHNVLVRKYGSQTHSYNYNSVEVCLPGKTVPSQFKHRSAKYSSITIDISNSLGFIYSAVVSQSNSTQQHGYFVGIVCQCYYVDGQTVGLGSRWFCKPIGNLNADYVFVWYDPYHYDSILLKSREREISFEFCVTVYTKSGIEAAGLYDITECGVCPIYYSESQTVLSTANLDKDLKLELYEEIQKEAIRYEARLVKYCDEKDNTFMQEWEWNENYQASYDCLIGMQLFKFFQKCYMLSIISFLCQPHYFFLVSNDNQVYENPLEKENSDDDDNSNELMKSKILHESSTKYGEETETSSHKQVQFEKEEDSTGECPDVDSYLSKAIKVILIPSTSLEHV
jgi:hypothetical protein